MVRVDTAAAYRWISAQADWLDPKVGGHLAMFCIRQMKRVNSCNGCAIMTAETIVAYLVLGLLPRDARTVV